MVDPKVIDLHGPEWFQRLVWASSVNTENVILTDHARQRMDERAITLEDVLLVLRRGRCRETPRSSDNRQDYRGRMDAVVAGRELAVIVAASAQREQLVGVTLW